MSDSKVIMITGSSSGFGAAMARELAGKHCVYATMRGVNDKNSKAAKKLRRFAERNDAYLKVVDLDVTSKASVNDAVGNILGAEGRVDVTINNAGVMPVGVCEAFTEEQLESLLNTNVLGAFRVNRSVLPAMRKQGSGLIIQMSSVSGRVITPFGGLYAASKFALEALVESWSYELAHLGIETVLVEPGPFFTPLLASAPAPDAPEIAEAYSGLADHQKSMQEAFEGLFENNPDQTDPDRVVEAVAELIDMAPGTRPLRTVVGLDFGVGEINTATEPHQKALLETYGLVAMPTFRAPAS